MILLKAPARSSWFASLETCFFNCWKRASILAYFSFGMSCPTSLSNIPLCQRLWVTGLISVNRQSSVCIIWSAAALYLRSGFAQVRAMAAFKWGFRAKCVDKAWAVSTVSSLPKNWISGALSELKTAGIFGTSARSSSIVNK